jgi:hypothetical protein
MKRNNYISRIITSQEDDELDQSSEILSSFSCYGFKSVQLALVKHGKVPEFQLDPLDKPLTYYHYDEKIRIALDIRNDVVVPEMSILSPETLKNIKKLLLELDRVYKSERDLIICYWYKVPLIGILIMKTNVENKKLLEITHNE